MGRPPKSTEQHLYEGTFRKHRHSRRLVEPPSRLIKPPGLSRWASARWDRLAPDLERRGAVASDSDLVALLVMWLEAAKDQLKQYAKLKAKDPKAAYTALVGGAVAQKQANALACKFGMSPIDRAKLTGGGDLTFAGPADQSPEDKQRTIKLAEFEGASS